MESSDGGVALSDASTDILLEQMTRSPSAEGADNNTQQQKQQFRRWRGSQRRRAAKPLRGCFSSSSGVGLTVGGSVLLAEVGELARIAGENRADSSLASKTQKESDVVLDEVVLKGCMEEGRLDEDKWAKLLQEVGSVVVTHSESDGEEEKAAIKDEFRCFAEISLRATADVEFSEHLQLLLEWMDPLARRIKVNVVNVKKNHKAMVRACRRGDLDTVTQLYEGGFRVTSVLSNEDVLEPGGGAGAVKSVSEGERGASTPSDVNEEGKFDLVAEIRLLEASAAPVYLIAEANTTGADPVRAAFEHLNTYRRLSGALKAFSNKLDAVRDSLFAFTLKMLDLCNGREQVETFLAHDDDIHGLSIKDDSSMPRVYQALQLKHKEFVTHDSSQQHIRRVFYADSESALQARDDSSFQHRSLVDLLKNFFLIPLYALAYIAAESGKKARRKCARCSNSIVASADADEPKAGWDDAVDGKSLPPSSSASTSSSSDMGNRVPLSSWSGYLAVPVNRLMTQMACYALFLLWIALTLFNPQDEADKVDGNVYDVLAAVFALGYIMADMHMMYQLTESLRMDGASAFQIAKAKFFKFFSNIFFDYRLSSHLIYFSGLIIEYIGYHFESKFQLRDKSECFIDDASSYGGFHAVKVGISLQGVGVVMIFTHALQFFRLHPRVGSIYVGLRLCISEVFSFLMTYLIITLAFGLGLHSILKHSRELCDSEGNPVEVYCNGTFALINHRVGVFCEYDNGTRTSCGQECWTTYVEAPEDVDTWKGLCVDASGQSYRPTVTATQTRSGEVFLDLGDEGHNRFYSFPETLRVLFWSLFDPGHPEVVGCSEGISRIVALTVWFLYNAIVVIVLLNLLIALMNVATNAVVEDRVRTWKYHRTHLWMDYCNKAVVLPPPFNLLSILVDVLLMLACSPCALCAKCLGVDRADGREAREARRNRRRHAELSRELTSKYASWLRTPDVASRLAAVAGMAAPAAAAALPAGDAIERAVSKEIRRAREEARREVLKELQEMRELLKEAVAQKKL